MQALFSGSRAKLDLMSSTFGDLVTRRRLELNLSQRELAQRIGKSATYINYVESGKNPSAKSGRFTPTVEVVDKIASVLTIPVDEARLAAGFAPLHQRNGKPETLTELLDRLEDLGIDNVHFADHDALRHATPEELQDVLDAVQLAIEVTLRRQNARTSLSHRSTHQPKG